MYAAVVDAARMVELLVACEASRSQAEVEARSAAAAMQLAASHTKYECLCHHLTSEHALLILSSTPHHSSQHRCCMCQDAGGSPGAADSRVAGGAG
jgi:hypothetical protein